MSNTAFNSNHVSVSGGGSPAVMDLRLTLASNTPVMTTAVTAATTLYLTPYKGNSIGLYSSGAWSVLQTAQVSLSLAALSANTNYDIFAYNNSGTVTLEALAWTSSGAGTSARATALAYQDGILIKSGDATRRYIGTIRTTGTVGQCEFSFGGIGTSTIEAKLFVWNYYNRVQTNAFIADNTASWTYSPGAWRAANNNSAFRASFVIGVKEEAIDAYYLAYTTGSASIAFRNSLGLDSVTAPHANAVIGITNYAQYSTPMANLSVTPSDGFHFVSAIESTAGSTATSFGYSTSQTGLTVKLFC
jgi:hypothetical protein